jgi:aryl-alcohol dehydrogenase-like predicted oxidoreductase
MDYFKNKLTLGTAQLGQKYGVANFTGKPIKKDALEIIRFGFTNGVKTIDTAPDYGESEAIIGDFVKEQKILNNKLPTIITKIPRIKSHFSSNQDISSYVKNSIESSLMKMNIQSIETCLLHNPLDMVSHNGKVLESLVRIKNEGLVKKIGVSVYSPKEVEQVISLGCFDSIQIPINILDHRLINSGLLIQLVKNNIEISARSIYLQGLIFLNPHKLPPNLQNARKPLEKLLEISHYTGLSNSELAMLFIRDLPEISKIIIGCETINQLKLNLKIMTLPVLENQVVKEIHHNFKDIPEEILNPTNWIN